jgi:hypothetical protein
MKFAPLSSKVFLGLMALAFCNVGLQTLIDPPSVFANVGIQLNNASALSSMRAVYGGMHLVFGLFCGIAAFRNPLPGLGLVMLYTSGYVIGRLSGLIIDGEPNEFVRLWLITETLSLTIASFLFYKLSKLQ